MQNVKITRNNILQLFVGAVLVAWVALTASHAPELLSKVVAISFIISTAMVLGMAEATPTSNIQEQTEISDNPLQSGND